MKYNYLKHGTNKQVYYKIYQTFEEIDEAPIIKLLKEAVRVDQLSAKTKRGNLNQKKAT